jgi:hypothetical protein
MDQSEKRCWWYCVNYVVTTTAQHKPQVPMCFGHSIPSNVANGTDGDGVQGEQYSNLDSVVPSQAIGIGEEAELFVCLLGEGLAAKRGKPLHETMHDIRLRLAVASARGTSYCIRGARTRWLGLGDTTGRTMGGQQESTISSSLCIYPNQT